MRIPLRQRGMTLIELMTVVIVVATLTTIAVSTYRSQMQRANRTEAKTALLRVQAAQEKFFLQNNRYADDDELEGNPPAALGINATTPSGFYTISLATEDDGMAYTASATANEDGGQASDVNCAVMSIDWQGTRGGGDVCWR